MSNWLARYEMHAANGEPEDNVVNDFAFQFTDQPTPAEFALLRDAVTNFYGFPSGNPDSVAAWISSRISRTQNGLFDVYEIPSVPGPLGSPAYSSDFGIPAGTNTAALPSEVAAVISLHADLTNLQEAVGNTRPRARRRGRVFIGPLNISALDNSPTGGMLSLDCRTSLAAQSEQLYVDALADGWVWSVWSRANWDLQPIVGGHVDNAPDTQRRRGPRNTARTVFTV